jgi:RNA polymerase sigma factor (sigma-70 family)
LQNKLGRLIFGKKNSELLDSELVTKYQKTHNGKYLSELFNRYGAMVYGVCLKYFKDQDLSKDGVIQIFEKIMDDLKRMKVTHIKSWLYMVAKNHCLMHLRKKQPHSVSIDELEISLEEEIEENSFSARELRYQQLEKAIQTLKEDQRKCIELFYLKELSYQQIEEQTNFSLKEVKSNIQNGKRNLKIWIENDRNCNL